MEIFNWNQVKLQFFTILENVARPWNGLGNQLTNYHLEGGHTFGSCKGSYHHSLECHLCKGRFMRDFLQWLVICPVILGDSWATTLFPFHLTHWIGNYILPCWCIGWGSLSNPLTLPETNIKSTWKWMVGILSYLPFGARPIFQGLCHVSFRECAMQQPELKPSSCVHGFPGTTFCPKHPTLFFCDVGHHSFRCSCGAWKTSNRFWTGIFVFF